MFADKAIIQYYRNNLIAYTDPDITNYYRKLIPKYYYVAPPMYPAHITIIRSAPIETPPFKDKYWNKYQEQYIDIIYDNQIKNIGPYWYLDVWSKSIEDIRIELGLERFRAPFTSYHITIGNNK